MRLWKSVLLVVFAATIPVAVAAKPLTTEQCAALKAERDKLAASGLREALAQPAPTQPQRALDDRGRQMLSLINIEGQLRFRCAIDLPIPTLKPELLVELPDLVEGEPPATPDGKTPVKRKAKPAAKSTQEGSADAETPGQRPPRKQRSTATTEGSANDAQGDAPSPPARKAKPRAKVEDAFKPPAGAVGDAKGTDAASGKSE